MTDFYDKIFDDIDFFDETDISGIFDHLQFPDLFDETMIDIDCVVEELNLHNYPRWFDLKAMLNCHTKDKLLHLSDFLGYPEDLGKSKSIKKAEVVNIIYTFLMDTLEARVLALSKGDFYEFYEFVRTSKSAILDTKDKNNAYLLTTLLPKLIQLGLVYVKAVNGYLRVYIPEEVIEALRNYKEIKRKNSSYLSQLAHMRTYVNAATNLYGIVTPDIFFYWVRKKIAIKAPFETKHKLDDWLITLISITVLAEKHYYYGEAIFASNKFVNTIEVAMFANMLPDPPTIQPYMPSENEIKRFSISTFDRNSFIYRRFTKELRKVAVDYNLVLAQFQIELMKNTPIPDLLDVLADAQLIVFESEEQIEAFVSSVIDLSNETRKWLNFGHKPTELQAQK